MSSYPKGRDSRGEEAMPLESGLQGARTGCQGQKTKAANVRNSVDLTWTDRAADSGTEQTHRRAEAGGLDRRVLTPREERGNEGPRATAASGEACRPPPGEQGLTTQMGKHRDTGRGGRVGWGRQGAARERAEKF